MEQRTTMSESAPKGKTHDVRKQSKVIEKNFVSENSRKNYIDKIITFALYLFDNAPNFLEEAIIPQMKEFKKEDDETFKIKMEKYNKKIQLNKERREKLVQQGERVNNKKIKDPRKPEDTRVAIRKYIRKLIDEIKPVEKDGDKHNSPIKIDGDGMITYGIIRDYMCTKKNVVCAEKSTAEKYLKKIGREASEEYDITIDDEDVDEDGMVKIYTHQSSSQYSGIRSGIAYKTEAKWKTIYNNMSKKNAFSNKRNKLEKQVILNESEDDEEDQANPNNTNVGVDETGLERCDIGGIGEVPVESSGGAITSIRSATAAIRPPTNFITVRNNKSNSRQTQMSRFVTVRENNNSNNNKRKIPPQDSDTDGDETQKKKKPRKEDMTGGDDDSSSSDDTDDLYE